MAEKKETTKKTVDPLAKSSGMFVEMPTSHTRAFIAKGEQYGIKGRLGKGPCTCIKKFMLPNGDIILKDDTFDPVEERMSPGMYRSLLMRKFFHSQDKSMETKLLKSYKTK